MLFRSRLTATPFAVVSGLTYNFLPFMTLPLYASLERIDPRTLEAAGDLYANGFTTFRKVTVPLSMPGVVAGTLLTFIPAAGDYANAALLGNPNTKMIGNVIESRFFAVVDYPTAAALSFTLMATKTKTIIKTRTITNIRQHQKPQPQLQLQQQQRQQQQPQQQQQHQQ